MEHNEKERIQTKVTATGMSNKFLFQIILIILLTIVAVYTFFNFDAFMGIAKLVASAFTPFCIGLILAFVLNLIFKLFDKYIFKFFNKKFENGKVWNAVRKPLCVVLSYVTMIALLVTLILFIVPELMASVTGFIKEVSVTLPIYITDVTVWIQEFITVNNINVDFAEVQKIILSHFNIGAILENLTVATSDIFLTIVSTTVNVASGIFTVFISIIFSIYFLSDKDRLTMSAKKILYSYTSRRKANRIAMFFTLANKIFSNYIRAQLTECLILGTLVFIGMSIIGLDFALLISTILAMCAVIPVIGVLIGQCCGAVLLLLVDPMQAIYFLVFFNILTQFEGNFIYPRVMGSSIGLPPIWTISAVTVMGGLFGIGGILLGPPIAGIIYTLLKNNTTKKLIQKEIGEDVLKGSEVQELYGDILNPKQVPIKQLPKAKIFSQPQKKWSIVSRDNAKNKDDK